LEEQDQEEDDVQHQIIEEVIQSIHEAKNKKLH
jgi:hypothetical protein